MSLKIERGKPGRNLKSDVEKISGIDINECLQCRKCSGGCPVAESAGSSPSEIIRRLQLGAGDELLADSLVWLCASCETCFSRCPMKIDMAAVMDALRTLAIERGAAVPDGNAPLLNRVLLGTVKFFGRSYDIGTMSLYKLGSRTFTKDVEKLPKILIKGKIALLPPRKADRKTVRRIFKKAGQAK